MKQFSLSFFPQQIRWRGKFENLKSKVDEGVPADQLVKLGILSG